MSDFYFCLEIFVGFVAVECVEVFPVQLGIAMKGGGGSTTDKESEVSGLGDINALQ